MFSVTIGHITEEEKADRRLGDGETMFFGRIRYKIMAVVGVALTIGLVGTAAFYTRHQEQAVLAQNERTMRKLTESVIQGLQSVMLSGSADIAQAYADRLKRVPEVSGFRIIRITGEEAFRDNKTIADVNRRRGEERFMPRDTETRVEIIRSDDANLQKALSSREPVSVYSSDESGARSLTFLAPIIAHEGCYKCHGNASQVRGVLKLTTSLASAERDILQVRQQSMVVLGAALMITMLLTGFMMGRSVVSPIEHVTSAMARVSGGDLNHQVPVQSRDELGRMAQSFNVMTAELRNTYDGLKREQDKLTTIILSAGEGIVVTDGDGTVVLVNPSAERLLGKTASQIIDGGLDNLLEDPETMKRWLNQEEQKAPATVAYNGRVMHVFASTIHNAAGGTGGTVGSAALLRDITEEKRLEEELRRLSTTDGLTGLFNRRHLDETMTKEFQRSERTRTPLSVIMCDVDHFKRFNDEHGHDQGDRVLRALAETIREELRKYDVPCRYGGEEFFAVLPSTGCAGAAAVAERLRCDVETVAVDGLKVTISIGVATYPDVAVSGPEQLIEAADEALYQSKRNGRNRVTVADGMRQDGAATETVRG